MSGFFVSIYHFFRRRRSLFYLLLAGCLAIQTYFSLQVRFEENITRFFPGTRSHSNLNTVFNHLRIKDKIIVLLGTAPGHPGDREQLIKCAGEFYQNTLIPNIGTAIDQVLFRTDGEMKNEVQNFVYRYLPLFLNKDDYRRLDSLLTPEAVSGIMERHYVNLLSPAGSFLKAYILRDPLGIAGNSLKQLQDLNTGTPFKQENGYLFSDDGSMLLLVITPSHSIGENSENDRLITVLEDGLAALSEAYPAVTAEYVGGPSVSVHNSRQIKKDTIVSITLSLLIIVAFIRLTFRQKRTILLILAPVVYGGLFALCLIFFIKGSISSIAVGAGSVVLGIAMSYSIHVLVHHRHTASVTQLIEEITWPLTIGSFTTIGAFTGLLFTNSELLRDFGLFASLSLIGTDLFCLIFLPHLLKTNTGPDKERLFRLIEKWNAWPFDRNKWLIGGIAAMTLICLFTARYTGFDSDLTHMSYVPEHLKKAETKLTRLTENERSTVLLVSTGSSMDEAIHHYQQTNQILETEKDNAGIAGYAAAGYFLVPGDIRAERLRRWQEYWTPEKKERIRNYLQEEGQKYGFRADAFEGFYRWLNQDFSETALSYEKDVLHLPGDWYEEAAGMHLLISRVMVNKQDKEQLYSAFSDHPDVVVFDRGYFVSAWVSAVNTDFYLVLYLSSLLIFFTLLISYGRIELALISFLPMLLSWIMIVGIMGMIGMKFNIVNIILSTFIFGIGDDFSIFVMDGLRNKFRNNKEMLNGHKTAIFFSAFTIITGMGALLFAKHPALQSISVMSLFGILIVVLVSYTVPPVLYRLLISTPVAKGFPPYTLFSLTRTTILYSLFLCGCLFLQLGTVASSLFPVSPVRKRRFRCRLIMNNCRLICSCGQILGVDFEKIDIGKETFREPAIVIANHQSFLDILFLLTLSPHLVMMTNHWVWKSPFFGNVIRKAGYFYSGDGYEASLDGVRQRLEEGFSVLIFPEGTRSYDGALKRFHKGAFYLAGHLRRELLPVVLYGSGAVLPKAHPFLVNKGKIVLKALPRICPEDEKNWLQQTKSVARHFKQEYEKVCREYDTPAKNPLFYYLLTRHYLFKGPVEEWYVRIKVRMERNYRLFDRLIPGDATVTDIGCGYGMLCHMLKMASPGRTVTGIDYDDDKIAAAKNGFLNKGKITFRTGDVLTCHLPKSDIFVLNDLLHYLNRSEQEQVLKKCAASLTEGGMILVRDGDSSDTRKQKLTALSEFFSTVVFRFNKTREKLCFLSTAQMEEMARACEMKVKSFKNDSITSNTIYLLINSETCPTI